MLEGGTANLTCRVDHNDNTSLQWSNPAQQTLFFGNKKGELVFPRIIACDDEVMRYGEAIPEPDYDTARVDFFQFSDVKLLASRQFTRRQKETAP